MAVKKAAAKAPAKKAPARKTAAKVAKGDSYACEVCGLVVTVDEDCGCIDTCDIICCEQPMQPKKKKAAAKK